MVQRLVAHLLPARLARQQLASVTAAEEVPELVAGIAAEKGDGDDPFKLHVAAKGEESGQHQNGLALEEGAEEQRQVAEVLQELLKHYGGNAAK
ncbi:hypothetical protein FQZ97_994680 [compost metagenome]